MSTSPIFVFEKDIDLDNWYVLDDGVMGGLSKGQLSIDDNYKGVFQGTVSLENNGGFSSIRYYCGNLDTRGKSTFSLRIKGDGKDYQFRIKESSNDYYSFVFKISTTGDWQTIEVPFSEMYASWRGRRVNVPNYSESQIQEVGILIGNKRAESFKLLIDKIEMY